MLIVYVTHFPIGCYGYAYDDDNNNGLNSSVVQCYKLEGHGFDSQWCHWNFSLTSSFHPHYDPELYSASNRNEYKEYFLGVRAAGPQG